jgi:hypothetical protein
MRVEINIALNFSFSLYPRKNSLCGNCQSVAYSNSGHFECVLGDDKIQMEKLGNVNERAAKRA